ncbi:Threonine/homoserine efflux transporter RhtA [Auraticoccus monumenti]|uniref:Threonine/homoserine efflux transporter RhtA n=1 Tax=Auraticoccus monumenti TaxID=675864 RepID=A0A1G7BP66_9ACTN|nr:Threonine/homoserine efflux transporter RhtA [Auraticoccus monumenti]
MLSAVHPATRARTLRLGVIACAVSALAYGFLVLFGRQAFATGASIPTVIGWRFAIASAVLVLVVVVARRPWGRGRQVWQPLLMGAVVYALQNTLFFFALQRIPAGLTSLLLYTMPVMVVLLDLARRRLRLSVPLVVAVLLALLGVGATMLGPIGALSPTGVGAGLLSAVVFTVYYVSMDTLPPDTDWVASSALVCCGTAATQVGVGVLTGTFDPTPGPSVLVAVVPMALVCTVLALSLLMTGVRWAGASVAAVVSCLEPVSSVVIGVTALGDPFGPPQAIGAAMVVAAVVVISLQRSPVPVVVTPVAD